MRNLTSRVDRLEGDRNGPDEAQMQEEAHLFIKKMQALADRFTEADRDMSMEDYKTKLSPAMRAAWKVRFMGADMETEIAVYLSTKSTDPDAHFLLWRY